MYGIVHSRDVLRKHSSVIESTIKTNQLLLYYSSSPAGIYLFKVNNRNTRRPYFDCCSGVPIVPWEARLIVVLCAIWYHSYNLKNVKNTHGRVLHLALLHGCFLRFLNCAHGTKLRNAPLIVLVRDKYHLKTSLKVGNFRAHATPST